MIPMTPERDIKPSPPIGDDLPPRRIGCASLFLGIVLVIAGIPMLLLPGPGIAAILGGIALIVRGLTRRAEVP